MSTLCNQYTMLHSGMKQLLQHKIQELIVVCNILMVFMRQQEAIVTDAYACVTMRNNALFCNFSNKVEN